MPGPFALAELEAVSDAYDRALADGDPGDLRRGSTSIRIGGLINRTPWFERIFTHPPLLAAANALIGPDIKLSAFHGRSVRAHAAAQDLHQDFPPLADGWPMLGFILMVDPFTSENGATRFLPESERYPTPPERQDDARLVAACGPAGTMIAFNGSVWHGHGANRTGVARRSIQGALIRGDQASAIDHARVTRPATAREFSPEARRLLRL